MTKYERLAQSLEQDIMQQVYKQGERLPSIGTMAKKQGCSKETVIKAYQLLIHQHLIYAKAQSGYYVLGSPILPISNTKEFSLETGNPAIKATSLEDAKHCLSLAIEEYRESSLNLSLQGVQSLRQTLADFFLDMGIYTQESSIYLIQGVTQMLSFLSAIDFPNQHTYILIEEPTYSYYVQFLKSQSLPVLTITRDENGIDLIQLQYLFQHYDIKFFYTIPRNHNPLGTTYSTFMRQKIAQLALKYNVYIIEDDYFGHCSSTSHYLPLYYYMEGQNCIYLTSFSKTIPYLRIGAAIIHKDFKNTFEKLSHQSYYYSYQLPSLISQATLESYIKSSLYKKQTQQLQNHLKKDYQIIKKVTQNWDSQLIQVISSYSGYYLTIQCLVDINLDLFQTRLQQKHIKIARNERCFYDPSHFHPSIRLSLARIDSHDLKEALQIFYQVFLDML